MPTSPRTHKAHAPTTPTVRYQRHEERGTSTQRGYDSRWQKARATYLSRNPLCVMCATARKTTAATVVDHVVPHRLGEARASGDVKAIRDAQALFWDRGNWQALCKPHHDSAKQAEERAATRETGGRSKLYGLDG